MQESREIISFVNSVLPQAFALKKKGKGKIKLKPKWCNEML